MARDGGVNFAVFSQHAERIECACSTTSGTHELRRYALHGPHDGVFHGFLPGVGPAWSTACARMARTRRSAAIRFNPHKLLLDPWAREIVGHFDWHPANHGYDDRPSGTASARSTRATTPASR